MAVIACVFFSLELELDVVLLVELDVEVLVVLEAKLVVEVVEAHDAPSPSHPSSQMQKYDASVSTHSACGSHGDSALSPGVHSISGSHKWPSP